MVPVIVAGVVADVSHNILSTGHMVAAGWDTAPIERRFGWLWKVVVRMSLDLSGGIRPTTEKGNIWKDSCQDGCR